MKSAYLYPQNGMFEWLWNKLKSSQTYWVGDGSVPAFIRFRIKIGRKNFVYLISIHNSEIELRRMNTSKNYEDYEETQIHEWCDYIGLWKREEPMPSIYKPVFSALELKQDLSILGFSK